jgi:hypothetical protein
LPPENVQRECIDVDFPIISAAARSAEAREFEKSSSGYLACQVE